MVQVHTFANVFMFLKSVVTGSVNRLKYIRNKKALYENPKLKETLIEDIERDDPCCGAKLQETHTREQIETLTLASGIRFIHHNHKHMQYRHINITGEYERI